MVTKLSYITIRSQIYQCHSYPSNVNCSTAGATYGHIYLHFIKFKNEKWYIATFVDWNDDNSNREIFMVQSMGPGEFEQVLGMNSVTELQTASF